MLIGVGNHLCMRKRRGWNTMSKDLITEARELKQKYDSGNLSLPYFVGGARRVIPELCDALEKAEAHSEAIRKDYLAMAHESTEREKALARLEAEVLARLEVHHEADTLKEEK